MLFGFQLFGGFVAVGLADIPEEILSHKVIRVCVARFTPLGELGAALRDDMVFIFDRSGRFLNLLFCHFYSSFLTRLSDALLEASLNKLIEITVQHCLGVAGFHIRS